MLQHAADAPSESPPATASATAHADVLIVGAGPAGLSLAAALADAGLNATVIEPQSAEALADPADDGREIALTHRARAIMMDLGLWAALPPEAISPLRAARVIDGSGAGPLCFGEAHAVPATHMAHTEPGSSSTSGGDANDGGDADADRAGADRTADALGWLVPNHHIRRAAWTAARRRPGVRIITGARVTGLSGLSANDRRAGVTLDDGRTLAAPLVVAADSRFSGTRRLAGIGAEMKDFGRSVVVGRITHTLAHDGVAWECFGYGNTLALLPMPGRACSAVVTVPSDRAAEWLALDDAGFAARIQAQAGTRLGAVTAGGPRHHYPLVGVYAHRFSGPRCVLIGDAAVGMHPVTAHGWNFGLYGIEVLARELRRAAGAGEDLGLTPGLARYAAEHRRTTRPIYLGTNAIVGLFTNEHPVARAARRAVLDLSEHAPGLRQVIKSAITAQLTGRRPVWMPPLPRLPRFAS